MKAPFKGLALLGLLFSLQMSAFAMSELEVSLSYKKSTINEQNYQSSLSYTGSYSYYFWSQSALELSYTEGVSELSVKGSPTETTILYKTYFKMMGLDLVFALAPRDAAFQPYIKVGAANISKTVYREAADGSLGTDKLDSSNGTVPSAGAGFQIRLAQAFALKVGIDAWTSPISSNNSGSESNQTIDYAGRFGVTMQF